MRKPLLTCTILLTLVLVIGFLPAISNNQSLADHILIKGKNKSIVDKTQSETFTVEVAFENTGKEAGEWAVNIAFEGEEWTWTGTPQMLSLPSSSSKTLTWTGTVPETAPLNSFARLVVYYGDSFQALNIWVHVISNARLTITAHLE
jgi:hypothetical protein